MRRILFWVVLFMGVGLLAEASFVLSETPAEEGAENITLSVVAVNPSKEKMQSTQVKIYLPEEVKPTDIMEKGELEVDYDTDKSIYYVYKNDVELAPLETHVFEIQIKDIWLIPEPERDSLHAQAEKLLSRLEGTDSYAQAKPVVESVYVRLEDIAKTQGDDTVSRDQHIGLYRSNLKIMGSIKEDLARLEKLLAFAGNPPVPEVLEHAKLKSNAPSKTTTWMIIFTILGFIALLGVVFFITWQRQARLQDFSEAKRQAFPEAEAPQAEVPKKEGIGMGS